MAEERLEPLRFPTHTDSVTYTFRKSNPTGLPYASQIRVALRQPSRKGQWRRYGEPSLVLNNVMRDYQPIWRIRSRMSPL
jgi:hypothetical protein